MLPLAARGSIQSTQGEMSILKRAFLFGAQAVERGGACCRGFGRRIVRITESDLNDIPTNKKGDGNLWLVDRNEGRNPSHVFFKFTLIPQGIRGYGKKKCFRNGWRFMGEYTQGSVFDEMEDVLDSFGILGDTRNHVHIYNSYGWNIDSTR